MTNIRALAINVLRGVDATPPQAMPSVQGRAWGRLEAGTETMGRATPGDTTTQENSHETIGVFVALSVAGCTAVLAADLPPPVAPAAYIPVAPPYPYNWSGFYIGGNLGARFSNSDSATDTFGSTFGTTATSSFLGGGQIGVNYEFWSFFVIGAEAMFDWLPNSQNTVNVTNSTITPGTNTATVTLNNRWVTMATGKLGYAWDRLLVYGKGGGAWVGTSSPGLTVNNVPASFTSTGNNNSFGATVGLGVEWAFADNWSARAEWDAILLQNQSFTVSGTAFGTDTITVNNRSINLFTAALNYKFGGWGY